MCAIHQRQKVRISQTNVPLISVLSPQISVLFFRRCPYFSRRFPYMSRQFPCDSGFCILAAKIENLQKRQGSCHTLPHGKWRQMTSSGIEHDGPRKLQSVFKCIHKRLQPAKGNFVKFPQKCSCKTFSDMYRTFGGCRYQHGPSTRVRSALDAVCPPVRQRLLTHLEGKHAARPDCDPGPS